MIGAITEVTQDPTKAGNAMKVVSLRLRGMKGELQELGEEIDPNVENISKMQGQILKMTNGKVNIFDDKGDFKSTWEIMMGIADVYDELSSVQQADLLETIAGKHRANDVAALLQNSEHALDMEKAALNSAGSAAEENERQVESLQGRINALTSAWQQFSSAAMDSSFLKGLVGGLTNVLDVVTSIINSVGVLPATLAAIGAALNFTEMKRFLPFQTVDDESKRSGKSIESTWGTLFRSMKDDGFGKDKFSFKSVMPTAADINLIEKLNSSLRDNKNVMASYNEAMLYGSDYTKQFATQIKESGKAVSHAGEELRSFARQRDIATQAQTHTLKNARVLLDGFRESGDAKKQAEFARAVGESWGELGTYMEKTANSGKTAQAGMKGFVASLVATKAAMFGVEMASMAMNAAITMGISVAVAGLINLIEAIHTSKQEYAELAKEAISGYDEQKKEADDAKKSINSVGEAYGRLSKGVNQNTGENVSLSTDEYEEYLNITNELAKTMPGLVKGYDAQGNAILSAKGSVAALNEEYKSLLKTANDSLLNDAGNIFESFKNSAQEIEKNDAGAMLNDLLSDQNIEDVFNKYNQISDEEARSIKQLQSSSTDPRSSNMAVHAAMERATSEQKELAKALEKAGISREDTRETDDEFIKRVMNTPGLKSIANSIATSYEQQMEIAAKDMRAITEAKISNELLSGNYDNISQGMQTILMNATRNMDYEYFSKFIGDDGNFDSDKFYGEITSILGLFNNLPREQQKKFELIGEVQSKYNDGKISVDEYISNIDDMNAALSGLPTDLQESIKISLGIDADKVVTDKNALVEKLSGEKIGMEKEAADLFAGSLTAGEMEIALEFSNSGKITSSMVEEVDGVIAEMEQQGIKIQDASRTIFGNVDLGKDRGFIKWTDDNIKLYGEALKSWGETEESIKSMKGTISSSYSSLTTYGEGENAVDIAFTPMLKTDNGLELLDKDTTSQYLDSIVEKATDSNGAINKKKLLSFDMTGIEKDGKVIKGLIAGVGEEAGNISKSMRFFGENSELNSTELMQRIKQEARVLEALSSNFDIKFETESVEKVAAALAESNSTVGLSIDSIESLKSRYAELGASASDMNSLFEETALGVRLNTDALGEMETALNTNKLTAKKNDLEVLAEEFKRTEDIINDVYSSSADKSDAMLRRDDVIAKMRQVGQEAAMYQGLVSKYAQWQNAEAAGQERDMYEGIITAHEAVKDELSRGWADDGTVKYLELLTGRSDLAGKSLDELTTVYNNLGNAINSSGYSINDWFTKDAEGKSTSEGFYNFLDTIDAQSEISDAVTKADDGSYTFDFEVVGGDEAIAAALGTSEEIVQIMLRAGKDAGFEINFEGYYEQFSDIVTSAEQAQAALNGLDSSFDFSFDFDSTDVEYLSSSIVDMDKFLTRFEDPTTGELDLTMSGATEALEMASTLRTRLDMLSDPVYMQIDSSSVSEELKEPLSKLQEYDRLLAQQNQHKLKRTTGSDEYVKNAEAMKETFEYFKGIKDEGGSLAESLGIKDLSDAELQSALDNQTLTIPTELDITANIDDNISKLVDMMMVEAGLKDPIEIPWMFKEQDGKFSIDGIDMSKYDIEKAKAKTDFISENEGMKNFFNGASNEQRSIAFDFIYNNEEILNKYTGEEQVVLVDFVAKNKEFLDSLENDEQRQVVYDLVAKNPDVIQHLTDTYGAENMQVAVRFAAENPDFFNRFDEPIEQKIALSYIAENGVDAWNALTEEQQNTYVITAKVEYENDASAYEQSERTEIVRFLADTAEVDNWSPEKKEAYITFLKETAEIDGWTPEVKDALVKLGIDPSEVDSWMPDPKDVPVTGVPENEDMGESFTAQASVVGKPSNENMGESFNASAGVHGSPTNPGMGTVYWANSGVHGSPTNPLMGNVYWANSGVYGSPTNPLMGNVYSGGANVKGEASNPNLGSVFSGSGFVTMTPSSYNMGGDFFGSGFVNMTARIIGGIGAALGGGDVNGTANVVGTAHAEGSAFSNGTAKNRHKEGDWSVGDDGVSLGGELGQEIVVRDGRFFTIGDNGAEFFHHKPGDIIFNHKQTEELFKNGYVTSGGGRGKALAGGTAFAEGTAFGYGSSGSGSGRPTYGSSSSVGGTVNNNYTTNNYYNGSSNTSSSSTASSPSPSSSSSSSEEEAEKFEESVDWIELAIDRIERAISRLELKANSVYKKWTTRNQALGEQIGKVREEIDLQQRAYDRYMQQAGNVGLSEDYASKVRDGTIDIELITDEDLKGKIDDYQEW